MWMRGMQSLTFRLTGNGELRGGGDLDRIGTLPYEELMTKFSHGNPYVWLILRVADWLRVLL